MKQPLQDLHVTRCSTGGAGPTDGGACEEEQPEQRLHGDASKSTPSDATAAGSAAQSIGGADCLPGGNPDHQEGALGPGAGDATSASHITSFRSPQPRATPQPSRDDAYRAAAGSSAADQLLTQQLLQRTRQLQALEAFREHMQLSDEDLDLQECALLIAKHAHPSLNEEACRHQVQQLTQYVKEALPSQPTPLQIMQAVNDALYGLQGFTGLPANQRPSADSSCLDTVLEGRPGSPILLGLLWQLVASQCGFRVWGLDLPGNFLLTPAHHEGPDAVVLIDPRSGRLLSTHAAAEQLACTIGVEPTEVVAMLADRSLLRGTDVFAARPRAFVQRVLRDLKAVYEHCDDLTGRLAIIRYLRAVDPGDLGLMREEGLALHRAGRHAEAAEVLRAYLPLEPSLYFAAQARAVLKLMKRSESDSSQSED